MHAIAVPLQRPFFLKYSLKIGRMKLTVSHAEGIIDLREILLNLESSVMESSVDAVSDRTIEPTNGTNEARAKMHYTGTVVKTGLAGAIIDIGTGRPAVIHISQIVPESPDQPIKRVEDVLKIGQQVDVWVKRAKDDRVELTMIKPLDLEWRDIKKGMNVKGQVVRLEKFGAFVEIGAERPGLIHISEMAHGYVRQPSDVVNEGDEVEAQVIDVNRKKKQIKLSIKALQPEPVKEEELPRVYTEPVRRDKDKDKDRDKTARRKKTKSMRPRDMEGGNVDELLATINEPAQEAEPTAMEIALREAMERAKARKQDDKGRKRGVSQEQEDILSRTLEGKAQS
jgi:predicted RNA-binding protein with RPS1 domain